MSRRSLGMAEHQDTARWVRRVHPFSWGIWIAITTIAVFLGGFGVDAQGYVFAFTDLARFVGWVSIASSVLFLLGAAFDKWLFLSWAIMLATAVFVSRFALYLMETGLDTFPMWISLGLAVCGAGAWSLEKSRRE